MAKTAGLTKQAVENLVLGAGTIYLNYNEDGERVLGATEGGNSFSVEREFIAAEFDGAKGKVMGARDIVGENATLSTNLKQINPSILAAILPGVEVDSTEADYDVINSGGEVDSYFTNVAFVGRVKGSSNPIVILLRNALSDGNLDLKFQGKNYNEAFEVTFSAHYNPDDLAEPIYTIRYPKIGVSGDPSGGDGENGEEL
jgi:hypothetical protein